MKREPLFIRVANDAAGPLDVVEGFLTASNDEHSKEIAQAFKDNLPDISLFKKDFKEVLDDIIDNGISQRMKNYVNSYMKPSLEEFSEGSQGGRTGEHRWVVIKEKDTPWIEALVCYNLCLYLRAYGLKELKRCPVCKKFFSNKGKYAKYCSESCKASGGGK